MVDSVSEYDIGPNYVGVIEEAQANIFLGRNLDTSVVVGRRMMMERRRIRLTQDAVAFALTGLTGLAMIILLSSECIVAKTHTLRKALEMY